MLDVHPPHAPTHTWKDFFIHIATIVVGLIIAVGLEQAVEAIHRHREATELREALRVESDQIVHDCERVESEMTDEIKYQKQVANLMLKSARDHKPIGKFPSYPKGEFDFPSDPVYLAAKASNKLELLTQQEIQAYGELDGTIESTNVAFQHRREALDSARKTFAALPLSNPGLSVDSPRPDNLMLTPASLEEVYKATISVQVSITSFRYWSRQVHGASLQLQQGDRDLRKIEAAERQFDSLP